MQETNKESEIEEEAPDEENYKSPREEDLEVVEALKEEDRKFFDEGSVFNARWQWFDDMSSEGLDPHGYFDRYGKVDDNCGNQLVMADNDLMEYFMKSTTAENESNKEALLVVTGEVERLRAENDDLKREKEALEKEKKSLEDKLDAERLELRDNLLAWKMDSQKLDAMLVEAKMKSQALVEELDSHSKFEEQMLETLKTYKKDCRKWEQENKDIREKFEEVTAAIGKDQQTLLNGQGHDCKYKKRRQKWKNEKIALKQQLVAASSWYQYYFQVAMTASYWNQYYMQRENDNGMWMRYYEHMINSLVESNTDLARRLEVETSLAIRYHNRVLDYEERCRKLEEDKNNLTAKLCAANASSELYRSMLHDLAS